MQLASDNVTRASTLSTETEDLILKCDKPLKHHVISLRQKKLPSISQRLRTVQRLQKKVKSLQQNMRRKRAKLQG